MSVGRGAGVGVGDGAGGREERGRERGSREGEVGSGGDGKRYFDHRGVSPA